MNQQPMRSATAGTAKTALVFVATLSLLLSLFAVVRPVIAFHEGAENLGPEVTPTSEAFPGGEPTCDPGQTAVRFGGADDDAVLMEGAEVDVLLADGSTATVRILSLAGNRLTFEVENGLAAVVKVKGGPATVNDQNVYDYTGSLEFPGPGIAHDDGLQTPSGTGISHVDFCLIPLPDGEIELVKDLVPSDDSGLFNLFIETDGGGTTVDSATDVGDGGTTGVNTVDPGTYEVSETAGTDTSLDDYDSSISCVDRGTTNVVASGDGSGPLDVTVGAGDDIVCTISNVRQTGQLELVKDLVPSDDSGLFNLFIETDGGGTTVDSATDVGDGGTTGVNVVNTGTYEVSETAGTDTSLDDYDSSISCVDRGTTNVVASGDGSGPLDVAVGADDDIVCTISNALVEELGSITIVKEIACEICETFTPGFFFNRGENNEGTAFTNATLPGNTLIIGDEEFGDGDLEHTGDVEETLSPVQEINAYLTADRNGTLDGEKGLSAEGQLVRQALALHLNILFAGEECDLAILIYTGDVDLPAWVDADGNGEISVQELLDAAQLATDEEEMRLIAEAIDEVNNSGDGDNPVVLDCPADTEGTATDGFTFDLFMEGDYPDGDPFRSGVTGDDGAGTLIFAGLPLETYVLVETTNEAGLECEIVDVTVSAGGSATLNDDGTVTITLTEEAADITLTVVNACEEVQVEEEEFGSIEIRKEADDDPDEQFFFAATWDADGFILTDGDAEFSGDLPADEEYTVTEMLTAQQVLDGWSIDDIDCGDADVAVVGNSVTITLGANESVICTFTNEQEVTITQQLGSITIIKDALPNDGQDFAFTTTGTGLSSFSLDDDTDATLLDRTVFSNLAAGNYTVAESATAGWGLTSVTCSTGGTTNLATRTASITLAEGANVVCIFVNTRQGAGQLPSGGGPAAREGTLAGSLPSTALPEPTGSMPAALLALLMLGALGATGYAMAAEVRRRR